MQLNFEEKVSFDVFWYIMTTDNHHNNKLIMIRWSQCVDVGDRCRVDRAAQAGRLRREHSRTPHFPHLAPSLFPALWICDVAIVFYCCVVWYGDSWRLLFVRRSNSLLGCVVQFVFIRQVYENALQLFGMAASQRFAWEEEKGMSFLFVNLVAKYRLFDCLLL